MANITKKGLDYFSFDVNFFSDRKVQKLAYYKGGVAISIYLYLLCEIYKEGYYIVYDEDLNFIIAKELGIKSELMVNNSEGIAINSEDIVKSSVEMIINVGLFDINSYKKHNILTSRGIQSRYELIIQNCKRKSKIEKYRIEANNSELISNNSEEMPIYSEEITINSELMPQSKVKESKEKETTKEKVKKADYLNWSKEEFKEQMKKTNIISEFTDIEKINFFNYYTAIEGKTGKMYFQTMKTWSMEGRLRTWFNNGNKYDKQ